MISKIKTGRNKEATPLIMSNADLYDRQRIIEILGRLRKTGGMPLDEKKRERVASWFRTLVKRNLVECKDLEDGDAVKRTYKEMFPNAMTRGQYTRSFLSYIGGLTDEEYQKEYPTIERSRLVALFTEITVEAGADLRETRKTKRTYSEN